MFAILKMDWPMIDGNNSKIVVVPKGRHEIERILNPFNEKGFWLVLKGTKIGMLETDWRGWQNGICTDPLNPFCGEYKDWQDHEIKFEE